MLWDPRRVWADEGAEVETYRTGTLHNVDADSRWLPRINQLRIRQCLSCRFVSFRYCRDLAVENRGVGKEISPFFSFRVRILSWFCFSLYTMNAAPLQCKIEIKLFMESTVSLIDVIPRETGISHISTFKLVYFRLCVIYFRNFVYRWAWSVILNTGFYLKNAELDQIK